VPRRQAGQWAANDLSNPTRCSHIGLRPETLTGILLISVGIVFLLIGIAPRATDTIARLHPLIYTEVAVGSLRIGTSPLAMIILAIIYAALALRS